MWRSSFIHWPTLDTRAPAVTCDVFSLADGKTAKLRFPSTTNVQVVAWPVPVVVDPFAFITDVQIWQ